MTPVPGAPLELVFELTPGGAPTVVLLHGLTQQRHFWGPVARRLAAAPDHPAVLAVDQRGHGDSPRPDDGPYDVPTCADDVAALLDRLGQTDVVVVGHSWGGWVATSLASRRPDLVRGLVLLDGGFVRLADLGPRAEVRERLTPPRLGIPLDDLLASMAAGELGPWWTDEVRDALIPTFEVGDDGLARTRLGFDRHMQVLDGALDYDPDPDFARITCPTWMVQCHPVGFDGARDAALARANGLLAQPRAIRLGGALHDVPLQWPALVAGLIRACVDEVSLPSWEMGQ